MERKEFMMSTGAAIATLPLAGPAMLGRQTTAGLAERTYHVFGVPLRVSVGILVDVLCGALKR